MRLRTQSPETSTRKGFTLSEAVVALAVCVAVILLLVMALPHQTERTRQTLCRANLGRIGMALALYDQTYGNIPAVPELDDPSAGTAGPLATLLGGLGQADFQGFRDPTAPPKPGAKAAPVVPRPIPGLVCPSDPRARSTSAPAPVSYRANAGTQPGGVDGPFAPGQASSLATVEQASGLGFTATFAERLIGPEGTDEADPWIQPGPITWEGCAPATPQRPPRIPAGTGQNWGIASWDATLYNHLALPSSAACRSPDGLTAQVPPDSAHLDGVHVLIGDGSVRSVRSTIDPSVWKALGRIEAASAPAGPLGPTPPDPTPPDA